MAKPVNRLVKYEQGMGIGFVAGDDSGKVVVGWDFPPNYSYIMYGVACDFSENVYISLLTISVSSPILRANKPVCSNTGVRISR